MISLKQLMYFLDYDSHFTSSWSSVICASELALQLPMNKFLSEMNALEQLTNDPFYAATSSKVNVLESIFPAPHQ